jgi:co-chaperonin GroES (HSP10)
MKALGNYILIKPIEKKKEKSSSGLLLTSNELENSRYQEGIVQLVGNDIDSIKEGQKISFDKVSGHYIKINDEHLMIITFRDVVLIFDEEQENS